MLGQVRDARRGADGALGGRLHCVVLAAAVVSRSLPGCVGDGLDDEGGAPAVETGEGVTQADERAGRNAARQEKSAAFPAAARQFAGVQSADRVFPVDAGHGGAVAAYAGDDEAAALAAGQVRLRPGPVDATLA
jgi:hypothetical protein